MKVKPKDFSHYLKDNKYQKPKVLILTSSADTQEQPKIHKTSVEFYKESDCKVLNPTDCLSYDCASYTLDFDSLPKNQRAKLEADLKNAENLIVAISSHGNIFWFLGKLPGQEREAMRNFAQTIQQLEQKFGCRVSKIILDGCYTASELKDINEFPEHTDNSSPARVLSEIMGNNVYVCGFNGKAASGSVKHYAANGHHLKSSYADNVVIFRNGEVLKGSQHTGQGQGLCHELGIISTNVDRPYYHKVFEAYKQRNPRHGLYRSESFSAMEL
jgi:hypothetical protein